MTHVTVSQDDLLLIQRALGSLQDGCGVVEIHCQGGKLVRIKRQDVLLPGKGEPK